MAHSTRVPKRQSTKTILKIQKAKKNFLALIDDNEDKESHGSLEDQEVDVLVQLPTLENEHAVDEPDHPENDTSEDEYDYVEATAPNCSCPSSVVKFSPLAS